jgi:hypothetical protein
MSDLPNPRKGEAIITIAGDEYMIKYSFANLVKLQKANKVNGRQLFEAIGYMDLDIISKVVHAGIVSGKQWPEKHGKRPPSLDDLLDMMEFYELENYVEAVMTALKGAEFVDDTKKKETPTLTEPQ